MSKIKGTMENKPKKEFHSFTASCVMANLATVFYLGYTIFAYQKYGMNDIPFAAFLCILAAVLTGWSKNRDKKNNF